MTAELAESAGRRLASGRGGLQAAPDRAPRRSGRNRLAGSPSDEAKALRRRRKRCSPLASPLMPATLVCRSSWPRCMLPRTRPPRRCRGREPAPATLTSLVQEPGVTHLLAESLRAGQGLRQAEPCWLRSSPNTRRDGALVDLDAEALLAPASNRGGRAAFDPDSSRASPFSSTEDWGQAAPTSHCGFENNKLKWYCKSFRIVLKFLPPGTPILFLSAICEDKLPPRKKRHRGIPRTFLLHQMAQIRTRSSRHGIGSSLLTR